MISKNDSAWERLFSKYKILEKIEKEGFFIITSKEINEFRESRLMTKFDHKSNLPDLFKNNNLSILPLTRGSYIMGKFEAYEKINYSKIDPVSVDKRIDLESLDYKNIYSESAALNCAFASGIIQDVMGEDCTLTVNGRMSSKSFSFKIKEPTGEYGKDRVKNIKVKNSQCEIDGGFEGETKLALIEAKNTKCDDFLIRQMYYPFRLWKDKISKKIIPIFMTYSNDRFSFFIYDFEDFEDYNSLKLIEQKDYIISPTPITLEDIKLIFSQSNIKSEPKVPFPQADKLDRVIDLLGLLADEPLTKEDITQNYDFDKRQTDYYTNAGIYLGLIEKYKTEEKVIGYRLTKDAKKIMSKDHRGKNLDIIKLILQHKPFYECFKDYLTNYKPPKKEKVMKVMEKSELYNVSSETTFRRRSQTILKWIEWMFGTIMDN